MNNKTYIGVDYSTQNSDFTAYCVVEVIDKQVHVLECDKIIHKDMYEQEKKMRIRNHVNVLSNKYGASEII